MWKGRERETLVWEGERGGTYILSNRWRFNGDDGDGWDVPCWIRDILRIIYRLEVIWLIPIPTWVVTNGDIIGSTTASPSAVVAAYVVPATVKSLVLILLEA